MCLYLHTQFKVSIIILTSFRLRGNFTLPPQSEPLKKPTLIEVSAKLRGIHLYKTCKNKRKKNPHKSLQFLANIPSLSTDFFPN